MKRYLFFLMAVLLNRGALTLQKDSSDIGLIYSGSINAQDLENIALEAALDHSPHNRSVYSYNTINTPGSYSLAGNVSNQITISSGNVTLDMRGHTISDGINGIILNEGLENITLKNGTIASVSNDGIQINANCNNILLKNITIKNALRGISFDTSSYSTVSNCDLIQNTTGLEAQASHNIYIEECTALANTNAGFSLVTSSTCSLAGCTSLSTGDSNTNSSGIGSFVFGFVSSGGSGNIFKNCIANSTLNLSSIEYNTVVAGFALRDNEQCSMIISSEAGNSTASPNGFTVPIGILLEESIDSTITITSAFGSDDIRAVDWSPDGKYIAFGRDGLSGGIIDEDLQIFEYNFERDTLTPIVGTLGTSGSITSIRWSHSGKYVMVGTSGFTDELKIFLYDRLEQKLFLLAEEINASEITNVAWSIDDRFVMAVGNSISSPSSDSMQIYKFDKLSQTLTYVVSGLTGASSTDVQGCDWHPQRNDIIAIAGTDLEGTSNDVYIYQFNEGNSTLTLLDSAVITLGFGSGQSCRWSPCGNYLAVSLGSARRVQIYRFDFTNLTISTAGTINLRGTVIDARWSSNGKYIAAAATSTDGNFTVSYYDRVLQSSTTLATGFASDQDVNEVAWSPDGSKLAVVGSTFSTADSAVIFSGLTFPSRNVIQDNKLYCNSGNILPTGFGISGSSISNSISNNVAFDNVCNYAFVANVFNQTYGDEPTPLQNISLSSTNPIAQGFDLPVELYRLEKLAESLIDNLI